MRLAPTNPMSYWSGAPANATLELWWQRVVDELAQCRAAQRRATMARRRFAAQFPARQLDPYEQLWVAVQRNPDHFPPHPIPESSCASYFRSALLSREPHKTLR